MGANPADARVRGRYVASRVKNHESRPASKAISARTESKLEYRQAVVVSPKMA